MQYSASMQYAAACFNRPVAPPLRASQAIRRRALLSVARPSVKQAAPARQPFCRATSAPLLEGHQPHKIQPLWPASITSQQPVGLPDAPARAKDVLSNLSSDTFRTSQQQLECLLILQDLTCEDMAALFIQHVAHKPSLRRFELIRDLCLSLHLDRDVLRALEVDVVKQIQQASIQSHCKGLLTQLQLLAAWATMLTNSVEAYDIKRPLLAARQSNNSAVLDAAVAHATLFLEAACTRAKSPEYQRVMGLLEVLRQRGTLSSSTQSRLTAVMRAKQVTPEPARESSKPQPAPSKPWGPLRWVSSTLAPAKLPRLVPAALQREGP